MLRLCTASVTNTALRSVAVPDQSYRIKPERFVGAHNIVVQTFGTTPPSTAGGSFQVHSGTISISGHMRVG